VSAAGRPLAIGCLTKERHPGPAAGSETIGDTGGSLRRRGKHGLNCAVSQSVVLTGPYIRINPCLMPRVTASVRLEALSFAKMELT
jgi:hypothetical protein